ncbi:hypothetical protein [Acaryochloris marina]|uniref:Uncharacterized protein n=1 Tax=Acaryochloris marina (strain MBIC 11017) TaxID=329726 RepID=A8ZPJ2_ACAM1|nr:hypothetical protein [Acaryochloris marina]ABW32928.1 hypothetical protein AM1_E0159 [Acaryochloris marina MBIC11017]
MADINRNPLLKDKFKEKHKLRNQLVISLKHHHHETLGQVPLDVAVNGMYKAWQACHSETSEQLPHGVPTEINPKMHQLGAIVRHLHR